MCVIAYYPAGLPVNYDELDNCFLSNPDGAGLMYYDETKHKVLIRKGFMSYRAFEKAVEDLPVDVDRVFHFRIATSGKVSPECCHPFPVTNDLDKMRLTHIYANMGFVHNGVIGWCTPKAGMKSPYSDSMIFGKTVLWELNNGGGVFNQGVKTLIEHATGNSKFAVMRGGETILMGDFQQGTSGAMYSNDSWAPFDSSSYSSFYGSNYINPYKIYFPAENTTNEQIAKIKEELDNDYCYVDDIVVHKKSLEFTAWDLPRSKTIAGYVWHIGFNNNTKKPKNKKPAVTASLVRPI